MINTEGVHRILSLGGADAKKSFEEPWVPLSVGI
jgi:hypothetical protein